MTLRDAAGLVSRYGLAVELIGHGIGRLLGAPPDAADWIRPWGDFGTCELLRVWLSYPPMAALLFGLAEVMAGALLLARSTTSLAALIAVALTINRVMLEANYCGTGAALYPLALLVPAAFLVFDDRRRLLDFLVLGRPTAPRSFQFWQLNRLPTALIVGGLISVNSAPAIRAWVDRAHVSPLRGAYRVESFTRDGRDESVAHDAPKRWLVVGISDLAEGVSVRTLDGTARTFRVDYGIPPNGQQAHAAEPQGALKLVSAGSETTLRYSRSSPTDLTLEGQFDGQLVSARLRKIPDEAFTFPRWRW